MEQIRLFPQTISTDWKWELKDIDKVKRNDKKVFSCFACGGGSSMGYKLAGYDVLGGLEIDPKMNAMYVENLKPKLNYLMDIREFNKLENLPEELYNLDILDGSPPCTTFSMAGDREKSWGKLKKFREGQVEQTLDDLSFVFIDTVKKLQPKVVVMENVEGIMMAEAWKYVQQIYKQFKEIGYHCQHFLLRGETMGVPQKRGRVFFIANRIGKENINMSFDYKPILYGEIKEGIGPAVTKGTQMHRCLMKADHTDLRIADVLMKEGEKERCFNTKIIWEENMMNTIPARMDFLRGTDKTRISREDILHAQTFPEDYKFIPDTYNNISYTCGMSVPPVMTKRIATRIHEQWLV